MEAGLPCEGFLTVLETTLLEARSSTVALSSDRAEAAIRDSFLSGSNELNIATNARFLGYRMRETIWRWQEARSTSMEPDFQPNPNRWTRREGGWGDQLCDLVLKN